MKDKEVQFYKKLYSFVNDPKYQELIVQYATMKRDKAVRNIRTKQAEYDYGRYNGSADAWEEVINLKEIIMKTMQIMQAG